MCTMPPLQTLYEETNGDAIITTGVGQHQMWAAQYYKFKEPRCWVTSGGLGSMGFGLPSGEGNRHFAWEALMQGPLGQV
jgi:acetolactate synthase-1/2/3 large subunit